MGKKTTKITVTTTTEASETVGYFIFETTGASATIFDVKDVDSCGWDYLEEGLRQKYSADGVQVVGYCDIEDTPQVLQKLEKALMEIKNNFLQPGSLDIKTEIVEEVDWLSAWQKNFEPIVLGNVCICPEWLQPNFAAKDKALVKLDSGIAFGTGYHETTSQCVLLAQQIDLKNKTIIDAGCGSGVLALSALKLGAKSAVLVDLDEQATDAAQKNAILNDLLDKCSIICGDLVKDVTDTFDVCFANLTADILIRLSKDLPRVLKHNSYAILSGILCTKLGEVEKAFADVGFCKLTQTQKGEWSALLLRYNK